ncbi:MAG: hypothetical protein K9I69_05195 [Ignavibacteriales bacterium]|nr:hypothetical protein [Ignavibacteriales bacterium]MCF8306013.1 hypothetical protein [Ignavibacteriales bacterium]MCF8315735.1 hypothetical protein [Ignavibacteriales bacterium]MCF8437071.1 hypothetical protein [Ignavibacteriales bacterium]
MKKLKILLPLLLAQFLSIGCGTILHPDSTEYMLTGKPEIPEFQGIDQLNLPYKPVPKPGEGIVIVDILDNDGKVSLIESMKRGGVQLKVMGR